MRATLADGTAVVIRELLPTDVEVFLEGFRRLSRRSILQRFNDPIRELTPSQVRYLTEVDHWNHHALCAHVVLAGRQHGVGVARFVRVPGQPAVAEFAVTVTDDYQGRGVGTALLAQLVDRAGERGVATLRGYVRTDNAPMLSLLDRYPCTTRREPGDLLRVELAVGPGGRRHVPGGRRQPEGAAAR